MMKLPPDLMAVYRRLQVAPLHARNVSGLAEIRALCRLTKRAGGTIAEFDNETRCYRLKKGAN